MKVDSVRAKECPSCNSLVGLSALVCRDCGYEWPKHEGFKHEGSADASSSVMRAAPPKWLSVLDISFNHHPPKPDKPPTCRVEYQCGVAVHSEWVCFQHEGFARQKAEDWWKRMGGSLPVPATVKEALSRTEELDWPREICVRPDGKFFRIVGRKMPAREEAA